MRTKIGWTTIRNFLLQLPGAVQMIWRKKPASSWVDDDHPDRYGAGGARND